MQPKTITEELLGSQRGVAKKICDPKVIKLLTSARASFAKETFVLTI